jgi:hypothetical protein
MQMDFRFRSKERRIRDSAKYSRVMAMNNCSKTFPSMIRLSVKSKVLNKMYSPIALCWRRRVGYGEERLDGL